MTVYQVIISYETDVDKSHLGTVTRTLTEAQDWLSKQVEDFKDAFWKIKWEDHSSESNVILEGQDGCYFYGTLKELEI